jgi:hypothetical protein
MSHQQVHEVAVRLLRGEVIEVTDCVGRRWMATHEALVRTDDGAPFCAAEGAYDVAVTLAWWEVTDRIPGLWPSVPAVA